MSEIVVKATQNGSQFGAFAETWGSNRETIDSNVPSERVLYWHDKKAIIIFKVACTWDPNVLAREKEKWLKYSDLVADLKTQCAVPVVVGILGVLGGLRRRLKQTKIFRDYQLDSVISDLQYEAIAGTINILRNHQGSKGETVMG